MIFIDGDNFAKLAREKAMTIALQYKLGLTVVANRAIECPIGVQFLQVDMAKDSADKAILALLKTADLLLSRDLLLCQEALRKGSKVMNDYGEILNDNVIKSKLIERKVNLNLAMADKNFRLKESSYSPTNLANFEKSLRQLLS